MRRGGLTKTHVGDHRPCLSEQVKRFAVLKPHAVLVLAARHNEATSEYCARAARSRFVHRRE